jgi:hypothetical protein
MKIKFILFISLVSLSLSSCKKYLTLEPQDGIVRQDFWQTKEQVESAVMGCYASMIGLPAGVSDRRLTEYLFLWGELRGDMLRPGTGISFEELSVMNVNVLSTNSITNWSAVYRTINYCNTVIDFAPSVLSKDNTFKESTMKAYVAEALGIRSLMYFYLARSFGDVPLKLKSTSSDEDNVQIAKSTQQEVFKQIEADLKLAEQDAVTAYGNRSDDKGRITKYSIQAILADLYLWMEQYENCITTCDKIINSNQFGLVTGDNAWFGTVFYEGNSNESIFELQFNLNAQNPFYNMFIPSSKRYSAALRVTNEIFTVDVINLENKDIRGDGAALKMNDGTIWKYQGVNATAGRATSASIAHWFFYRYPDVLLMKAEASNQVGKGDQALSLVNTIRARANALPATEKILVPTDKEGIADYILEERAREFAFEGKRWYDLLRNAKRNNYARLDLLLDVVSTTASVESQQTAITKYRDYNSHYFPYFLYELQTNKNLVQNPFYQ